MSHMSTTQRESTLLIFLGTILLGIQAVGCAGHRPSNLLLALGDSSVAVTRSLAGSYYFADLRSDSVAAQFGIQVSVHNRLSVPLKIDSVIVLDSTSGIHIPYQFHGISDGESLPRANRYGPMTIPAASTHQIALSARIRAHSIFTKVQMDSLDSIFLAGGFLTVIVYTDRGFLRHRITQLVRMEDERAGTIPD
jgi:hypothetical protein